MGEWAQRGWRAFGFGGVRMALLLVLVALALLAFAVVAESASADHCDPDTNSNCQPHLPPGPEQPVEDCPLPEGHEGIDDLLSCVPGPSASFVFEALEAHPVNQLTSCTVKLEGATPPSTDGSGRVQFRTSNSCDRVLHVVTLDSKLLNSSGNTVATAPQSSCHQLAGNTDCGVRAQSTQGDVSGLPPGEYVQQATVRLILEEPQAPDPWILTPGTTPQEPADADPATTGICAPGQLVVRCNLLLPITVNGGRQPLPRFPEPEEGICYGPGDGKTRCTPPLRVPTAPAIPSCAPNGKGGCADETACEIVTRYPNCIGPYELRSNSEDSA